MQGALDDGAYVAGYPERFAPAAEIQQHPDDPSDPVDLLNNDFQPLVKPGFVRPAAQKVFRTAADDAQRRADFVRQPGGQGADRGQLVRMAQPTFQLEFAFAFVQQPPPRYTQLPRELSKLLGNQSDFISGLLTFYFLARGETAYSA